MRTVCLAAVVLLCLLRTATAGLVLSVDLDPVTPGVQSSRVYSVGATVEANFVLELTAPTRITAYIFSVRYDTNELAFVSRSESSLNIPGWSELNPGSAAMASGLLFNYDAFGPTLAGPSGPFVVGSATFTAIAPTGGVGDRDIEVGQFNPTPGIDGFLDDSPVPQFVPSSDVTYSSASVNVVPEPSASAMGMLAIGLMCRRRCKRRAIRAS